MKRLLLLSMLASLIPFTAATESKAAVVGSWNFDACTAQDSGGSGLDGTVNGTSTCVTGVSGKALRFANNGGYVEVPDDLRLSPLTHLVLEAAVKPDSLDNIYSGVIHKQGSAGGGGYSLLLYGEFAVQFSAVFEGESAPTPFLLLESVPLNQWTRLKVEVDTVAGKVRFYLNGALKSEQDCPKSGLTAGTAPLRLGAADLSLASYGLNTNLNGAIDDVRISTNNPILTATLTGAGAGAVNSIPSGIACTSPSCSAYFASVIPVTLIATPDADSVFGGWSGACNNASGDCTVTMSTDRTVNALFRTLLPVKLAGNPERFFADLSKAYQALTGGSVTILARDAALADSPTLSQPVSVKLAGGYDSAFGSVVGKTLVSGTLAVRQGTLRVRDIVLAGTSSPVASSTPADAATGVPAATSIQVRMNRPLDAATVNAATVSLIGKGRLGSFRVPGVVSYDQGLKAVKLSTGGLPSGCSYTLTLSGLKDGSGNPVPDAVVTFATLKNQVEKTVDFRVDGSVQKYGVATFETDGRIKAHKVYTAAGADGAWFTPDDVLGPNESYSYNYNYATRRYTLSTVYSYFGASSLLDTNYYFDADYNLTRERHYAGSFSGFASFGYDSRGFLAKTSYHDGYDDADPLLFYTMPQYDPQWIKVRETQFSATNADGTPAAVETVAGYRKYLPDQQGRLGRTVTYDAVGTDGVWFTADDAVGGYWDQVYQANGSLLRAVYHGDPGADGAWFTADDLLTTYVGYRYDAQGNRSESVRYAGPGPDGTWFTADDLKGSVSTYDTTK